MKSFTISTQGSVGPPGTAGPVGSPGVGFQGEKVKDEGQFFCCPNIRKHFHLLYHLRKDDAKMQCKQMTCTFRRVNICDSSSFSQGDHGPVGPAGPRGAPGVGITGPKVRQAGSVPLNISGTEIKPLTVIDV